MGMIWGIIYKLTFCEFSSWYLMVVFFYLQATWAEGVPSWLGSSVCLSVHTICLSVCLHQWCSTSHNFKTYSNIPCYLFKKNTHNKCHIAHPWGWDMGYLLWVQSLIYVLPLLLPWCIQYHMLTVWRWDLFSWLFLCLLVPNTWHSYVSNLYQWLSARLQYLHC